MALATLGAADPVVDLPPNTLLLLVAPWCAPCWGELANIEALAKAALPLHVRVLAMDDGVRARAMTADLPPDRRWAPPPADRVGIRAALWARTPGLPFSVATDDEGKICAEQGGGLTDPRVHLLAKKCASRAR